MLALHSSDIYDNSAPSLVYCIALRVHFRLWKYIPLSFSDEEESRDDEEEKRRYSGLVTGGFVNVKSG